MKILNIIITPKNNMYYAAIDSNLNYISKLIDLDPQGEETSEAR